ncbi:hypothetical protein [Sorangium sp. So ce385]|uniref:hypothetical protein n=1 Tax=Sorangium sp. So ce385 TaxID=3133308 RepID=UPI003F5C0394
MSLLDADPAARPVALFTLPVKSYLVEFASLDFFAEERLSPAHGAILALAQAMGRISADDVRTFLGLGWELSPALVAALERKELLRPVNRPEQQTAVAEGWQTPWQGSAVLRSFLERMGLQQARRAPTSTTARRLQPPGSKPLPPYELTPAGVDALAAGVRRYLECRPTRMWLAAEPLCFLGAPSESAGYAAARRSPPLPTTSVPASLRILDELLALEPTSREAAMGLPAGNLEAERLTGLARCTPGASWQLRDAPSMWNVYLVITGRVGARSRDNIEWNASIGLRRGFRDSLTLKPVRHLDGRLAELLQGFLDSTSEDLARVARLVPAAASPEHAGIPVLVETPAIEGLLGRADRPQTTWLSLPQAGDDPWQRWIHVRALPASQAAAHEALLALVARRTAAARGSLKSTVEAVWSDLVSFWRMPHLRPPDDAWVRRRLWERRELRGTLCAERLDRDLIAPYATPAGGTS